MSKILNLFFISFFTLLMHSTYAQVSFSDHTDILIGQPGFNGVAICVTDMNNDGKDDIIRLDNAKDLIVEYQQEVNTQFETITFEPLSTFGQWSMCVGDIDNNGTNEILSGGAYNGITLTNSGIDGDTTILEVLDQSSDVFLQGSNFVDINNDGHLDIFACHDDGASYIWENDGLGGFSVNTDWIDLSIDGNYGEPASGNYGSIWSDIDSDGDLDLYIAKCRQGVTNVEDHRRINKLYINDGNGNFTEEAELRGLNIGWQSWTADMQDINNDGYLDVFITNHDHSSQMFLNDGTGHFTELHDSGVDVTGLPIQGIFRDFDNDGWVDLLVSGSSAQLFMNNGDLTFTEIEFEAGPMQSFALGDLNSDGFVDIYAGYAIGFNGPSTINNDKLWLNDGGDNNFIAISLIGNNSNKNSIGAKIEIYGEWGMQMREVRSGESYGIMNSLTQYFGVGQAEIIDSIVINWPSGLREVETEIGVNTKLTIQEGNCLGVTPVLLMEGNTTFCTGDSLVINVSGDYTSYAWSNGSVDSTITIFEDGIYSVIAMDELGCTSFSESINVTVDPTLNPVISLLGEDLFCEGDTAELILQNLDQDYPLNWNTGENMQAIQVVESGLYSVDVEGLCQLYTSNAIEITVLDYPDAPSANGDSIYIGEVALMTAVGDNIAWYSDEIVDEIIGLGDTLEVSGLLENTSFYAAERRGSAGERESVGMVTHAGTLYSGVANNNNLLIFDAISSFRLDSVKVHTDTPGIRKMLLLDSDMNEIKSIFIDVPIGENYIYVGLDIPAGLDMSLTTDANTNQENIGFISPRLQRSSESVEYPYIVEDIVEIKNSNFGTQYYYYFYDWKISNDMSLCPSERTKVDVIVEEEPNSLIEVSQGLIDLYPNPSTGHFNVEFNDILDFPLQMSIYDQRGSLLNRSTKNASFESVELKDFKAGVYVIEFLNDNQVYRQKLVVIN